MKSSRVCLRSLSGVRTWAGKTQHLHSSRALQLLRHQAPLQASRTAQFSTSRPQHNQTSLVAEVNGPNGRRPRRLGRTSLILVTGFALGATVWYSFGSGGEDESLNKTRFTAFNIISKEQVSPTAFVLTIRSRDEAGSKNLPKLKAAWEHGLWSVEMKQPQIQIARHYTPLPPLDGSEAGMGELRFLIRKMDGGEMSNYLSRLQVGEQVWLRGPHYGFEVSKRLGEAKEVVFLAGGTGIAPALQLAHKLLDGPSSNPGGAKPSVRILWANRKNVDSIARNELSSKPGKAPGITDPPPSSFSRQLLDMKRKHGDHFAVDYYVDDEKFVTLDAVDAAMGKPLSLRKPPVLARADKSCRWHSHERLAAVSDEEDATADMALSSCTCRSHRMPPEALGKNLVCVSGPDGFVEAYAGSKRWFGGREVQGPVQGLLGAMKRLDPSMDDWLVLKL